MTIHKLSAGSGYEYLTRQVAALDTTEMGATPLADYYSAKGESPGRWVGSGLVGVDGLEVGDVVTAEQMKHLFGTGSHPLTGEPLGAAYRVYDNSGIDGFNAEVAKRVRATGESRSPYDVLARVRSEVAREYFVAEHGREPATARELSDALARYSRPRQSAVAGFDLTFSPVKSVSALWAVAPTQVARAIEDAHDAAVADALAFIEREVLFTREGRNGARQVETRGLIGTAFTHRDSRAGDPDLHTHVAVANKVQTRSGKWLSIYGKVLHEHVVAASETYNTALERRLVEALGVRFVERPGASGDRKRPVREIEGVAADLCERWSQRRTSITARQRELAREFRTKHGRPPTPVESVALAQQANLETREAKHEPRSYADQRQTWRSEAVGVLGSERNIESMVSRALRPMPRREQQVTTAWIHTAAERVITEVESRQATWQVWHLLAEAQRQLRGAAVPADRVAEVAEWIVDDAVSRLSITLTPELDPIHEPSALLRTDGTSVYRHTGRVHYTSRRVLEAEQRIVDAAGRFDGLAWSADDVRLSVLAAILDGVPLNRGQQDMVTALATSGARVQLALAPAGSGKTTAMQVLANVWTEGGHKAVGLAPSAAAASALAEATGMPCETLAKVVHDVRHGVGSSLVSSIGPGTLMVIDEAGMADTLTLASVIEYAVGRGASVRLIGDDRQLAAIGAGGVLRDIASTRGAVRLDELVRFADPAEAEASLALREGDQSALGFYLDNDRVHVGDADSSVDEVFEAWQHERAGGRDCLILAPTRELVRELNLRAQAARGPAGASAPMADGCAAHIDDVVISRRNDRRLGVSGTDWVKNGDRWQVEAVRADGGLAVRHLASRLHATLPADYVAAHVELGYASTVHTAQGITTDVVHGIVTGTEDRQLLYTMLTRGRIENHAHLVIGSDETHALPSPTDDRALTATEALEGILARDGAAVSATTAQTTGASPEAQLHDAVTRYADAVTLAASMLRADLEDAGPGPLPWLPGIPEVVADHPSWGPYLSARSRRASALASEVARRERLPRWTTRYGDVLTAELRRELAVWRAGTGVPTDERSLAGPSPRDDDEAVYHRNLTNRINARYGEALHAWQERIVAYVGHRDEQTGQLARYLDGLQRKGVDAERVLDLAVARKPLPVDHPTAALAFRVKDLVARRPRRTAPVDDLRRTTPSSSGPALGL
ncbi:MobF family relaxase [Nocardioides ginsengisoli]|uniref:MobF family relaxase n=1 Tax=Nocardioides ginsengisoli TaxID=363868 RepID=A0ABW3W3I2_9ACTN